MIGGPKPKPTRKKRLEGNPGRRPLNAHEPTLPSVADDFDCVPAVLADDAIAASEWRRLAPLLRRARMVTDADRNVLVAACQQWSVYQHALTEAPAQRRVLRSPNNYPIPNPFIAIANRALFHCERLWESLGLTPSARSRVSTVADGGVDDAFAEFDLPRLTGGVATRGPSLFGRDHVEDDDEIAH